MWIGAINTAAFTGSKLATRPRASSPAHSRHPVYRTGARLLPAKVGNGQYDRPLSGSGRLGKLESDVVIHRNPQFLRAAGILFSRLYGHVPEEELDLIQLTDDKMTQMCAGASEIMR